MTLLGILLASPLSRAETQASLGPAVGVELSGARFGQSLLGVMAGPGLHAFLPLKDTSFSLRLQLDRLSGSTARTGVPCGGFVPPGTCDPEPVRDAARVTSGSAGLGLAMGHGTVGVTAIGALRLAQVSSETRGLATGTMIAASKPLWGGEIGIEAAWVPWRRTPLSVELGALLGGLGPVKAEIVEDGYTPFERGSSEVRLWLGVSWRPPQR